MKTVIWKGIEYNSLEYFNITKRGDAFVVNSKIIGTHEDKMYSVDYGVRIDARWLVRHFTVAYELNGRPTTITGERNADTWKINGREQPEYNGFNFIDITLTPFTNTLPIRNLRLEIGEEREIDVIYMEILENTVRPVRQKYPRNSENGYRYQNVPNDFEADIRVDTLGLVTLYPTLFDRIAENDTNHDT